jgi:hypothetical protein
VGCGRGGIDRLERGEHDGRDARVEDREVERELGARADERDGCGAGCVAEFRAREGGERGGWDPVARVRK